MLFQQNQLQKYYFCLRDDNRMGNCAGCAGPQRKYQVQRVLENSPIKSRLSQGAVKYYQPNSNIKEFSLGQKQRIPERGSWNQNQMIGGMFNLAHSKNRPASITNEPYQNAYPPSSNNLYGTQKNSYELTNNFFQANVNQHTFGQFTKDLLSQAVRTTNIKLYADNPEIHRQSSPTLQKSFLYNREEDLHNSRNDFFKRESNSQSYSNQLLKSVQSESKKYLRGDFPSNEKINQKGGENPQMENILARFDEISQIRTEKMSRNEQGSLPLKKYSKYNRDLAVIEQILQEDHKTPLDIRQERKNNGEDVIFDTFEGFPEEIEPLQIPNFSPYFTALKEITQKS